MGESLTTPVRRILNMKEAASYLGMSVTTFRECVAPNVAGIQIMRRRIRFRGQRVSTGVLTRD